MCSSIRETRLVIDLHGRENHIAMRVGIDRFAKRLYAIEITGGRSSFDLDPVFINTDRICLGIVRGQTIGKNNGILLRRFGDEFEIVSSQLLQIAGQKFGITFQRSVSCRIADLRGIVKHKSSGIGLSYLYGQWHHPVVGFRRFAGQCRPTPQ